MSMVTKLLFTYNEVIELSVLVNIDDVYTMNRARAADYGDMLACTKRETS